MDHEEIASDLVDLGRRLEELVDPYVGEAEEVRQALSMLAQRTEFLSSEFLPSLLDEVSQAVLDAEEGFCE